MTGSSNGQIQRATAPFPVDGGITSVFGRTGVITAQNGDYTISQISGAGTAAAENLSSVITDNGSGALTIGNGQITAAMLSPGLNSTAYSIQTANYTFTTNDYTIEQQTTATTNTLPSAVGILGKTYRLINTSSGTITLSSSVGIGNASSNPTTFFFSSRWCC